MSRFVPLTDSIVTHVAAHMRPADVAEGEAMCNGQGFNRLHALRYSVSSSKGLTWGILATNGEPMAALGAGPSGFDGVGVVWLLGTPLLDRHGKTLVQGGRMRLDEMNAVYPVLTNSALSSNTKTLKWLQHMGFSLLRNYRLPPLHEEFTQFIRYSKCVHS